MGLTKAGNTVVVVILGGRDSGIILYLVFNNTIRKDFWARLLHVDNLKYK